MNKFYLFLNLLIVPVAINFSGLARAEAGLAEAPLIRSEEVDETQFRAFADSEDRPTLADYYESNRPSKANQEKFHRLVEKAQALWLKGSVEGARIAFKEVSQLTLADDWRDAQRESIFYADLRLAQTALTPDEALQWTEKAVRDFPDLTPAANLFPPPLVAKFEDARAHLRTQFTEIDFSDRFRDYRYVLINGRKYDLDDTTKILLAPGTLRITLLSNIHSKVSETMTASQLRIFQFVVPPIASGTCQDPHLADGPEFEIPVSVVYKNSCYRTHNRTGWLNPNPEVSELQLKGQSANLSIPSTTSQIGAGGLPEGFNVTKPEPFITRKSVLIIGASVVAAGLIYAIVAHQQKTETQATHSQGY